MVSEKNHPMKKCYTILNFTEFLTDSKSLGQYKYHDNIHRLWNCQIFTEETFFLDY